jgi:hypothetical protein
MKKIFLILSAIAGAIPAFSQLSAGTQGLTVKSGTTLSTDGLVLQPSTDFQLDSKTITVSATPVTLANGTSIKRVFSISPSAVFSGVIGIKYTLAELNGNDSSQLAVSLFNGAVLTAKPSESDGTNLYVFSDQLNNVTMNNVTAGEPIPGVIVKSTGSVSSMNTTYGTVSTAQSFSVSGTDILDGITVTAPAGFEVSLDNNNYAASVNLTTVTGIVPSTPVYVRIKSTTNVGSPTGYVVLTSPTSVDAPRDSVLVTPSSVTAKSLTIANLAITPKEYNGSAIATASGTATLNGVVNSDNVSLDATGVTYTFNNAHAGVTKPVTVIGYSLTGPKAGNYLLTPASGITGNITQKAATVTVAARGKCFAENINGIGDTTSSHFTTTGFLSGEGVASVDMASTGFPAFSPATTYTITASNATGKSNTTIADYNVTYVPAQLTVASSPNATITTAANVQLCSGNAGSIAINTSGTAPFTGRFRILNQLTNTADTFTFTVNNAGPSAPSIPASYLLNNSISPLNYKISWASLKENNGGSCFAADNQLTGEVIITVFPVPAIDATSSVSALCNGSGVTLAATNPNGVGGTYNVMAQYNGVTGGNIPVNGLTNRQYTAPDLNETLSLNGSVTSPVTVNYIFTPITTNTSYSCVGANDTVKVIVNPKPRFEFAVNSTTVAPNGTDTICQAVSTTFAITNATNGHTFTVKHTWVDGNNATQTNNNYASGTVVDGGFSNTFVSGGNSVTPSVNPANEPTAGTYEITMSNPNFTGCTTTRSFNVYVQPKPEFTFAVNGDVVAINGTDTICQAAPTTFAIANATNGYTFAVKHTWRDGNNAVQANNSYASGTIANGGFSASFTSGGNSVNPSVNPSNEPTAGTYEITLTNPTTGCTTTRMFNVYVQPKPQFGFAVNGNEVSIDGTDTICQAAPTTFAITNATNGQTFVVKHTWVDGNSATQTNNTYASGTVTNGGFSASFTSGGNSVSPSVSPTNEPTAGAYEITMTNPTTGCTTTRTYHVYVQPKPEFAFSVNGTVMNIGATDTICQAAPTTIAIVNATNGQTFTVKHTWVDGNGTAQANNNYGTGTVTNGGFSNTFISGGNSVNPSVNPGNEPTAGAYEITMTNPTTGCTTTRTFNIYVQPKPEFAFAVNGNIVAINGTDTICQAAPTTFAITNATNGQTFAIAHTWVDGNSIPHTSNYGGGTIANGGFSASFTSGGNSVSPSVNPTDEPTAGAYQITMTNPTTGCTTVRTFNIYVQPKPQFGFAVNGNEVAINGTDTICQAAPTTLAITNATNGQTFVVKHSWIDGNGAAQVNNNYGTGVVANNGFSTSFISGGNSVTPSVNPGNEPTAGAYEITMTNPTTGCTTTRTYNVYVNPKPVDLFKVDGSVLNNNGVVTRCAGTPIELVLEGNAAHSYELTHLPTFVVASGHVNDPAINFTTAMNDSGSYQLILTDDNTGCTNKLNYSMVMNQSAAFTAAPGNMTTGNDAGLCSKVVTYTATAVGTGSTTFTHQFAGATTTSGFVSGDGSGTTFNKGVTTVTLRASNSTCADKDSTFTITVNDTENPTISYTGGNIASTPANHTGCTYELATTAPVIADNCGNGGLTLTYALTGATVTSGNGPLGTFDFNVGQTTVTYTVKDEANNQATTSYTVNVSSSAPAISVVGSPVAATCYGSNTGSFVFHYENSVSGMTNVKIKDVATGNIIYTQNNPISVFTSTQTNLYAGTYRLLATNIYGCTDSTTVVIGQPSAPLALGTGLTSTNVVCGTPNSGTLTFGAQGGTAPYTVTVTGPNISATPNSNFTAGSSFNGYQLTGLGAGTYTVSVTDAHSCNIAQSVTIVAAANAITASVSAPGVPACLGDAAPNVTFTASGGTAPYTFNYTVNGTPYSVNTTGSASTVTVPQATTATGTFTYSLTTITDANGTPCATNITNGQGSANVVVNDCSGPDLVPVVLMPATSFSSVSVNRAVIINLSNIGTGASHGLISVTILKPAQGFTYAAPNLPSGWSFVDNGATITFSSTNIINSGSAVTLSGTLSAVQGANALGVYTMTTFVSNGSGGESNSSNNVKFTTVTLTP